MMKKIAIHSVPRSGSSWLGELFNSSPIVKYKYQPLFSYALKGYLDEHSSKERIALFFERLNNISDPFLDQTAMVESGKFQSFKKNTAEFIVYKEVRYHHILLNLLEQDEEVKVIGLVRNPYAVLNSWFKAPREFRKDLGWKEELEWYSALKKNEGRIEEFYGFEKWLEVALLFDSLKNKFPDRFYFLKYSDLLADTEATIRRLFDFCGIPVEQQTLNFIVASREKNDKDAYSVFKKRELDSDWENELNDFVKKGVDASLNKNSVLNSLFS